MTRQCLNGLIAGVLSSLTKINRKRKVILKVLVSKRAGDGHGSFYYTSETVQASRVTTKCDESAILKSEKPMESCIL